MVFYATSYGTASYTIQSEKARRGAGAAGAPRQLACNSRNPTRSCRKGRGCNLCGQLFTAPAPKEAGLSKYDPQVGPMLGYLRFGTGVPHYRLDRMQVNLGVRLPASTQWELMAQAGQALEPVHEALFTLAAQGKAIHNDDTTMRVQSLAKETGPAAQKPERTGIFTTGLISQVADHMIALFVTGHRHAGENLDQLLARRAADSSPPIQMCDALSRNPSKEFQSILANCLSHGRRQFVDVAQNFPQECQHVLERLGEVYQHEAQAKKAALSPEARLRFHQERSQKIMDELRRWMSQRLEQKLVEPNSGLGQAFGYMLNHQLVPHSAPGRFTATQSAVGVSGCCWLGH